jgi:hypothetical protein
METYQPQHHSHMEQQKGWQHLLAKPIRISVEQQSHAIYAGKSMPTN